MPKRLMSCAAQAALVVAFAAGSAAAQLTKPQLAIIASPDPEQTVVGKTVLTSSATVLQGGHDYRVELGLLWSTEWKNPGTGFHSVVLPFTAKYAAPSSVKPGKQLCFSLARRMGPSSTVIATSCRTVTAPSASPSVHHPFWSPGGDRLIYFPSGRAAVAVDVRMERSFGFSRPRALPGDGLPINVSPGSLLNHDVAPDGRFVTVADAGTADGEAANRNEIVIVQNWAEELKRLVPP